MLINELTLRNFRTYTYQKLQFKERINVIEGRNGAGKTSIAEAIYYLSLGRSFRGVEDKETIKHGSTNAVIDANVDEGGLKRNIKIVITQDKKAILINGKSISKLSELSNSVNVILFEPKDVLLFKGLPKERRNFLDIALSKQDSEYLVSITEYNKLLHERNELLKIENLDTNLLNVLTDRLINISYSITQKRAKFVKDINDILIKITRALAGVYTRIEIDYKPFVTPNDDFEINAKKVYEKALENDLKQKATTVGIHREDFSVSLDDKDIATYGSQGENRLVALGLKLSPYFLIKEKEKLYIKLIQGLLHQGNHTQALQQFEKATDILYKELVYIMTDYQVTYRQKYLQSFTKKSHKIFSKTILCQRSLFKSYRNRHW